MSFGTDARLGATSREGFSGFLGLRLSAGEKQKAVRLKLVDCALPQHRLSQPLLTLTDAEFLLTQARKNKLDVKSLLCTTGYGTAAL